MSGKGDSPTTTEIEQVKSSIETCYERLEDLEKVLENQDMDDDQRKAIETELKEMRKRLHTNKELLTNLQNKNFKYSYYMAGAAFALAVFLVWMLHILVNGPDY